MGRMVYEDLLQLLEYNYLKILLLLCLLSTTLLGKIKQGILADELTLYYN